ncbi:MAG: hypothetical protein ACMUEM_04045 [Flavobacteriales bacterium AspAUS03]
MDEAKYYHLVFIIIDEAITELGKSSELKEKFQAKRFEQVFVSLVREARRKK